MPMGCVYAPDARASRIYPTTHARAKDHVRFLKNYLGGDPSRYHLGERRPWDLLPCQLNEHAGTHHRALNYFAATQVDELRQWHIKKLAEARRSPLLRAKEAHWHLNPATGFSTGASLSRLIQTPPSTNRAPKAVDRPATVPTFRHYTPPERSLLAPKELLSVRPTMAQLMHDPSTPDEFSWL